jgi:uncharacterized protein YcbX
VTLTVSSLHVYPIKSCRGLDLTAFRFDTLGPLYDRRLMIVDAATGHFLTQRDLPRMALITPRLAPTALQVSAPNMPILKVSLDTEGRERREITVWRFTGPAEDLGDNAAAWVSSVLERACRLVRMPEDVLREVNPERVGPGVHTAFTDGYPVLIVTRASLDDLNGRMQSPVPMNRFRPNIVIAGAEPFAEDKWKIIRIGEVELDVVKPCARCAITTVDAATAAVGKEPLKTLATYRTRDNQVLFGQNAVHRSLGSIRNGDAVEILQSDA